MSAIEKIRKYGVGGIIARKADWYSQLWGGWRVERGGNVINLDGMTFSLDWPHFTLSLKNTISKGQYEAEERELVRRWLPADVPVVELGGGLGAVSCLANRKLADPKRHLVVEANPAMVPVLERNRDINGCQFTVTNKALGYDADTITMEIDQDFVASSAVGMVTSTAHTVQVPATGVAAAMADQGFDRVGIICDIEGAEAELVKREFPVLGEKIRYILAELHPLVIGEAATAELKESLLQLGFAEKQTIGDCIFYSRD